MNSILIKLVFSLISIAKIECLELNQTILFQYFGYSNTSDVIDLSNQNITSIDRLTFRGLSKLGYLYLQNNKLERLEGELFLDLLGLRQIWFESNNIVSIDDATFYTGFLTPNIKRIVCLNDNPFIQNNPEKNIICHNCIVKTNEKCQKSLCNIIFDIFFFC